MVALRCTKRDRQEIRSYARSLTLLLEKYRWLTDAYIVEFYVKDHWHSLPTSWQKALDGLEPSQLANYLSTNKELRHTAVWPLSLLAFCAATQSLALNRYPREPPTGSGEDSSNQLDHCFKYHVKNKKRHEIQTLADIIHRMCKSSKVNRVVDVGGGQGHLSRLLSAGYGLKVMSIEAAGCHVDGAAKVDKKVEILMKKRKRKGLLDIPGASSKPAQPPVHIVCTIDPDISVREFVELVNQHTSLKTSESTAAGLDQVEPKSDVCGSGSSPEDNQSDDSGKDGKNCKGAIRLKEHPIGVTGSPSVEESVALQQVCLPSDSAVDPTSNEMEDNGQRHDDGLTPEPGASTLKPGIPSVGITQDGDIVVSERRLIKRENAASAKYEEDVSSTLQNHQHLHEEGKANLQNGFQRNGDYLQQSIAFKPNESFQSEFSNSEAGSTSETFSLVGLHTCGDLGPTILRVFTRCHEAKVLALVGCCYMKMHCVQPTNDEMHGPGEVGINTGFPMSRWVGGLCENKLTFEPMELACHFFDTYYQRLKKNDESLKLQVYRAMLEVLIQKEEPDLVRKHAGVKQIKKAISGLKKNHNLSFQSYAEAALKKLGLSFDPIAAKELEESCFPDWTRVIVFHCLRLCLAPIIESLITVDRMLFLLEHGVESELTAVFDPFISPRNFLLQATKT